MSDPTADVQRPARRGLLRAGAAQPPENALLEGDPFHHAIDDLLGALSRTAFGGQVVVRNGPTHVDRNALPDPRQAGAYGKDAV
ncbi:MAG: hypothetical protein OXC14_01550, partial [Rhodospirillaceae bacterium]|nr:hypothetical protein [Rhodospirillaceae bacterium]